MWADRASVQYHSSRGARHSYKSLFDIAFGSNAIIRHSRYVVTARNHGSLAGNGCVISRWILRIGENLRESVLRVDTFVDSSRLEINRFLGESGTVLALGLAELSFKAYWHG